MTEPSEPRFEFTIDVSPVYEYSKPGEAYKSTYTGEYRFEISLPHQCGSWEICGLEDDNNIPWSREQAIKDLELFIQEAQEALEELRVFEPDPTDRRNDFYYKGVVWNGEI